MPSSTTDALATLRHYVESPYLPFESQRAALACVEAEIARLRDGLRRIANRYCLHAKGDNQQQSVCLDKPLEERCSVCIARALLAKDGAA